MREASRGQGEHSQAHSSGQPFLSLAEQVRGEACWAVCGKSDTVRSLLSRSCDLCLWTQPLRTMAWWGKELEEILCLLLETRLSAV